MKTASALIIGAAALLQLNGFVSAETCASYVDYATGATLCGANGVLTSDDPEDITCDDEFVCTFDECCVPETCTTATLAALCTTGPGDKVTLPARCDGAQCRFDECCQSEVCTADYTCTSTDLGPPNTCTGKCTDADCCSQPCITGATDFSGTPYQCDADDFDLVDANLGTDCGADGCDDGECCDGATPKTCGDGHFTCSVPGQGVPIASADEICDNECDDAQCGCTVVAVTCREELHGCSSGTRVDTNTCPGGINTCTDALCCEPETESTITEARMMRTPRSRISGTQYGA